MGHLLHQLTILERLRGSLNSRTISANDKTFVGQILNHSGKSSIKQIPMKVITRSVRLHLTLIYTTMIVLLSGHV